MANRKNPDKEDYSVVESKQLENLQTLPLPVDIRADSSMNEVIDADMEVANNVLKCMHQAWGWVQNVNQVMDMANATMNILTKRRTLLNKQLGVRREGESDPLDITD